MRTIVVLPLAALVAVAAGCGSDIGEQAARSVPQRDLTLVTQTAQAEIASPVELRQPRIQHRTVRPSQWAARLASARRPIPIEPKLVLAAAAEPVTQPATAAATSDNARELLPGKTVTVIPASSGPSAGSDRVDEFPPEQGRTMAGRHGAGGRCGGRGRGPDIGAAPRPDFR